MAEGDSRKARRKACVKRYSSSAKGKAVAKAARIRYLAKPGVKDARRLRAQEFRRTPEGREAARKNCQRANERLRMEALRVYGGNVPRCNCECGCEESKIVYLDLDHPNNDGADHRRALGCGRTGHFVRALKRAGWPKHPPIRVLCVKCNVGRQRNGGQCPELGIISVGVKKSPPPRGCINATPSEQKGLFDAM